ncbi:phosphatase PAP2 family protein [Maribellus sp. YY47]|uniref:phosphatase PAP2 family protein n=1 Tax=Maribellus sp. YY47 TaxID=2929486 RepID=UPI0020013B17|nr:phosphatase PAP2 family protein [Maribellus sp. YY47]MCK3682706.1 phosphatase PAP2 family protein [Maribellus sp. YY47]
MGFLDTILNWDQELFLYLNSFHNDFWDTIMLLVTRKETWLPFFVVILYYIVKNYRTKAILIIIGLALVVLAADQLSGLMKIGFQRLRPVHDPAIGHLVHNVLRKGGMYGFVSSHAANSVAILVFTSLIFKRRSYSILLFLWAAAFCYSRIYSGVHYPFDILGGILLGWGVGWALFRLMMFVENHFFYSKSPRIEKTALHREESGIIWLVFVVLVVTFFIVTSLLHHFNYL